MTNVVVDAAAAPSARAELVASEASASPHDTLVAALERSAQAKAPYLTLHVDGADVPLDGAAALEGALRWATTLRRHGVERGDRVPLLMTTSRDFVEAFLGTMLIGAAPAPLAAPMTFGAATRYLANLVHVVRDAGARCVVTTPRMRDAIANEPEMRDRLSTVLTAADATDPPRPGPLPSIGASDLALLQYTSGTTGRPKGVAISHRALVANAFAIARGLDLRDSDVGVSWLPMFHDMGLVGVLVTAVCHPFPVHVFPPEIFVMQPRRWLERISRERGTLSAAPNFAYELCNTRGSDPEAVDLGSWRAALSGAEPVHATTVDRFSRRYAPSGFVRSRFMPVYGLAESTLAVAFPDVRRSLEMLAVDRDTLARGAAVRTSTGELAHHAISVGRPVAGATIRVVDEAGGVVPERVVGEVLVRGPSLMDGYFRNDEASAEALSDGWLRTGDLGFADAGRLFIVGRSKDVIIKAGRNVYAADVERVANEVQGVVASAAFARPNETTGTDDLVVVLESREKDPERREQLVKTVTGELLAVLSAKADAVHVWPVASIPRTTSGKIRRAECGKALAARETA